MAYSPWVVVGDSPSGAEGLAWAADRHPAAQTITCNGGWRHFNGEGPDAFLLFGSLPTQKWLKHALELREKWGTRLVTIVRDAGSMRRRGVHDFDEFINLLGRYVVKDQTGGPIWRPGYFTDMGMTGLIAMQYPMNRAASHIIMAGMEGYTLNSPGLDSGIKLVANTQNVIEPITQELVDLTPDTQWTFIGDMQYEVTGPNVEIIGC